ncbi:MAG: thioredoxin domain-containing protein [Chromatiales bacterium]|nr:thioredoxin domain-containing protein [Chromatiales bacterium]
MMAHESFEDEATAQVMNELFVNIKVDREERPDLDRIYQTAHQMLTQRGGGWPLTMFLTPDDQHAVLRRHLLPDGGALRHAGVHATCCRAGRGVLPRARAPTIAQQNDALRAAFGTAVGRRPGAGVQVRDAAARARRARRSQRDSSTGRYGGFGQRAEVPAPDHHRAPAAPLARAAAASEPDAAGAATWRR